MFAQITLSWIFINIFCSREDNFIWGFRRFSMNFCMCGVTFVLLAKLKCKLWQHKVEKMHRFLCMDMIDFCRPGHIYVTRPEKTGLIYTNYTYSYLWCVSLFCVCYPTSVSCIGFLRNLYIYDEICVTMLCCQDEILHLKD